MDIYGTSSADRLFAWADFDRVYGLGGDDTLISPSYTNGTYLDGGVGNDRLTTRLAINEDVQDFRASQVGGFGDDTLDLIVDGFNWNEAPSLVASLSGGTGEDDITVQIGGNYAALTTTISVSGGLGDDLVSITNDAENSFGRLVSHRVRAGDGDDLITIQTFGDSTNVANTVFGDAGNDRIAVRALAYEWDGVIDGEAINTISGGIGDDRITAVAQGTTTDEWWTTGSSTISGDDGNDIIRANSWHKNVVTGGNGNDNIAVTLVEEGVSYSLDTQNFVDGGYGNDVIVANGRSNTNGIEGEVVDLTPNVLENRLLGGNGNDTIRAAGSVVAWDGTGSVRNVLLGGAGADNLYAEVVEGSTGANRMFGHAGNDRLQAVGGSGNLLHGGIGRDVMIGGAGSDTFTGGGGIDTFIFAASAGGRDVISDFGDDDRIGLLGLTDQGNPGLFDDFVASVDTVVQMAAGVEVRFDSGAVVMFSGVVGDSVVDFVTAGQLISTDTLV